MNFERSLHTFCHEKNKKKEEKDYDKKKIYKESIVKQCCCTPSLLLNVTRKYICVVHRFHDLWS